LSTGDFKQHDPHMVLMMVFGSELFNDPFQLLKLSIVRYCDDCYIIITSWTGNGVISHRLFEDTSNYFVRRDWVESEQAKKPLHDMALPVSSLQISVYRARLFTLYDQVFLQPQLVAYKRRQLFQLSLLDQLLGRSSQWTFCTPILEINHITIPGIHVKYFLCLPHITQSGTFW